MSCYCLQSSDFLEAFLPLPPESQRKPKPPRIDFEDVAGFISERDLAERWVAIVNKNKSLCRGYVVCLPNDRWDPTNSSYFKVDGAIYPRRKHPTDGRPHWGRQRAFVQFRAGGPYNDPFDGAQAKMTSGIRVLASYTAYAFARQQRTASFVFLINGTEVRVSRWERAGTIFTEAFDYVRDPGLLSEFLWRFSMLPGEDQGLDPTALLLTRSHKWYKLMDKIALGPLEGQPADVCGDEGTMIPIPSGEHAPLSAFKYVREKFAASLQEDSPRYRVAVPTKHEGRFKYFLTGKPTFEASGLLGRGTRGYIAIDVETKCFVWLKDVWRPYYVNVQAEGINLETLQAADVSSIPTMLCAGDLRQETQMHNHWKPATDGQDSAKASEGSRGSKRDRPGTAKPTARSDKKEREQHRTRHLSHYRLVVSEVCLPLTDLKTPRQLVQVVLNCVQAHEDAVTNAKLLHGDLSIGNILILPTLVHRDGKYMVEWRGLLSDWECATPTGSKPGRHRPPGTWQFRSAALLYWLRLPIAVEDEVESFFHIILYLGARFLWSNISHVRPFLHSFFDSYELVKGTYRCGSKKMMAMQSAKTTIP
ncbi:hypothetical protein OH76DRAFT_257455 [Lentinus brumalis]|uniref:Fungal-type protein kinase domain-containing protein n=1 Tax=Lentinus brumalis TaxID=2498619 RepID=A0A371CL50_9APHY|nr:hypothetical protein OH76DRAFT_257455 [Polyporus brumalis]